MKKLFNFSFINLGCTKNLVDTQHLMGNIFSLAQNNPHYDTNYFTDAYSKEVSYVFLNTCGFIKAGRDEMFATIKKLQKAKKKIYLLGCGLQYFKDKTLSPLIKGESGGFDKITKDSNIFFISRSDFENISLQKLISGFSSTEFKLPDSAPTSARAYTNAEYGYEYIKIAEGCNNKCTFCIIPRIRGGQKSVEPEKIINEIKNMINAGIEEIIIISQDTSQYGSDLEKQNLISLLEKIDKIKGDFTYRLLYLYPDLGASESGYITFLKKLKKLKKLIPYFDLPFQHASPHLLKRMGRCLKEKVEAYLSNVKEIFPHSYIRTNFIIGFPGETEKDNEQLLSLIKKGYFDNIALFEYHDENLATSNKLDKKVSDKIIRERFTKVRQLVNKELTKKEEGRKGINFTGYIVEILDENNLVVRPKLHAPDIDPYDEITLEKITGIYNEKNVLDIGDKINYTL